MNNQMLFRVGGIAAILSAVFTIALPIFFFTGNESLATASVIIAGLMLLVLMIPLSLDLSTESQGLVVAAAILLAVSTIWGFFLDPINVNPPIFGTTLLASGLGSALYGWLQYRSDHYPNGMGIVALLNGVLLIIGGILMIGGTDPDSIGGMIIPLITILQLVWFIWLGWYYLKGKSAKLVAA